ncbi:magnesium-dependent phosphatase-1, partial [Protomyces lactucae-debilis]
QGMRFPKLIVFDLDYTLWPLWIDTHISPPLKRVYASALKDRHGETLAFYKDVPGILVSLHKQGVALGIASRTSAPDLAREALTLLQVQGHEGPVLSIFSKKAIEIYPGSKMKHFRAIHKHTGIAYEEMIFFDDEARNREVAGLGVTFVLVPQGVTQSVFERGLRDWR